MLLLVERQREKEKEKEKEKKERGRAWTHVTPGRQGRRLHHAARMPWRPWLGMLEPSKWETSC